MPTDQPPPPPPPPPQTPPDTDAAAKSGTAGKLSEAARRALAEAAARRAAREATAGEQRKELDGRDGPEPTRYGDWEKDGLISDF